MSTAASSSDPGIARAGSSRHPLLDSGTSVEVRGRFDGRWCTGFDVADRIEADASPVTYRLRRRSDGTILPLLFTADDVMASARPPIGTRR